MILIINIQLYFDKSIVNIHYQIVITIIKNLSINQ